MKFGIFGSAELAKRRDIIKDLICKPDVTEDERNSLIFYSKLEKGINYGGRVSILPFTYFLYRRKFFDKNSPFFIREIGLTVACVGFIYSADYLGSQIAWGNCQFIIRKYKQYTEKYFLDEKSFEKMQRTYLEQKNAAKGLAEDQNKSKEKDDEKMYD